MSESEISEVSEISDSVYAYGLIYKMTSDNGLVYVGSTLRPLAKRLSGHKKDYKLYLTGKGNYITSFKLFEDNSDVKIELLEQHKDISKLNLHKRERHFIESIECVNKCIPGRSKAEHYKDNKNKISEIRKDYYKDNKDKIALKMKEYQTINKDKIAKQKQQKIVCEVCKCQFRKDTLNKHNKSIKHITNNTYNITNLTIAKE
jgi:hypothetical protein